jgi:rubrerythrin
MAETMEQQAGDFYSRAARQAEDVGVRHLLGDLAEEEKGHENRAGKLATEHLHRDARGSEDKTSERKFVLQYVQPGLMDGSVSTLAPLFAAAFATHHNWQTFVVSLAASIGAGINMAFAEALSDDGFITGRGSPWLRGVICGAMTTIGSQLSRPNIANRRPNRRFWQWVRRRGFLRGARRSLEASAPPQSPLPINSLWTNLRLEPPPNALQGSLGSVNEPHRHVRGSIEMPQFVVLSRPQPNPSEVAASDARRAYGCD